MSGHSKWSSIKHKKGAADAKRGQLFTKLTRALIDCIQRHGGQVTLRSRAGQGTVFTVRIPIK